MKFENLNLKGKYKTYDSNGRLLVYQKNDVVFYDDKTYVAIREVAETSPAHGEQGGWALVTAGSNPVQFFWGEELPQEANIGDEWFNTTTGRLYKFLSDDDSDQWVNIY